MADLHPLLFGSATDPVDITKEESFRVVAQRVTSHRFLPAISEVSITIENVTTGLFFTRHGFDSRVPKVLKMSSLGTLNKHQFSVYEFLLPPTPTLAKPGDLIEAHVKVASLSVEIFRIRYIEPREFPLADRRFPRRRKIPFTAVQDARRIK